MQKQPFSNVPQNRCSYRFPDFDKIISLLKSLFNKIIGLKVTGLKACNFIKKETPTQVFSSEYHKICKNSFFYGTTPVAASENG